MFLEIRNLVRRPHRTLLTLCGIGVGAASYMSLVAVGSGLLHEFQQTVSLLGSDLVVQQGTAASVWVSRLSSEETAALRALPHVSRVTEVVVSSTRFLGQKFFVVFGLDPGGSLFDRCRLHSGRWFVAGAGEMMIGDQAARVIGLDAGDRIEARGQRFLVAGVYETGRSLLDGAAIMDLKASREMFDYGDNVTLAFVDVSPSGQIENVLTEISTQLPSLAADRSDMWVSTYEQYMVVQRFTRGLAILALLVTALWVSNTLHITFSERRSELAVLRAIGWRAWRIASAAFGEAFALSVMGGALGIPLAWLIVRALARLDEGSIYATQLTLGVVLEGVLVSVVVGMLGAILPIIRVLRIPPAQSLRAL